MQYELAHAFCLGILLGLSRHATESLLTATVLHSLWNLIAVLGVAMGWYAS